MDNVASPPSQTVVSNPPSDGLHQELKLALESGEFAKAQRLSFVLGQAILQQARTAPPTERAAIARRNLELFQEHLSLARVLKAHLAAQYHANLAASLYVPVSDREHCWHFEA
jgi:hypothetical protein